jgi:hypothetical protein
VIAGDREIVNVIVTSQVPRGAYARPAEVAVYPVGFHTLSEVSVNPCARGLHSTAKRTCTTESYTLRSLYGERR